MDGGATRAARLRLASGLVLMAFAAGHFANHALGIVSLEAMERGRGVFLAVWRNPLGSLLLYGALLLHVGLALEKLYRRRSLRMPAWQAGQIALGLAIPLLLAGHIAGTRGLHALHGVDDGYARVLLALWPDGALSQSLLLLAVWLHGCIGLHYWLRLKPWHPAARPWLLAAAVLLPALALVGFADAGREVRALAESDPARVAVMAEAGNWAAAERDAAARAVGDAAPVAFAALLAPLLAARALRGWWRRRHGLVRITYPDGRRVAVTKGASVLEASRMAGIPHAAVCGGRGRCSTCRVRVGAGAGHLPPPSPGEAKVLDRLGLPEGVRLACQLRPTRDVAVAPLLPATAGPRTARAAADPAQGIEREVAVLFSDLRGFTRLAEGRLPYDTVFVLNQYFRAMGQAIEDAGGHVDKFIGDGIMALFGVRTGEPTPAAARRALAAARAMAFALDRLNRELQGELPEPLRMGIGLHAGPVILGEMGHGRARSLTAIGDVVNVASRLEALSKAHGAQLVVSEDLARRAGIDLAAFEPREIEVRGRRRTLAVRVVPDARALPEAAAEPAAADVPAAGAARRAWAGLLLHLARRRAPAGSRAQAAGGGT